MNPQPKPVPCPVCGRQPRVTSIKDHRHPPVGWFAFTACPDHVRGYAMWAPGPGQDEAAKESVTRWNAAFKKEDK